MTRSLLSAELTELGLFLDSDSAPEGCMSLSELDGFLTGLVIGPETTMPSEWLPEIWGESEGDEMVWESPEQLQRILGLIMAHYNNIAKIFHTHLDDFAPILPFTEHENQEVTFIDEWCAGFLQAVDICLDSWQPLMNSEEYGHLFFTIYLNGCPEGWEQLEDEPALSEIPQEVWVKSLYESIPLIYKFFLPFREAERQVLYRATKFNVGRNEPCPCGSGKKFKHCCGKPPIVS